MNKIKQIITTGLLSACRAVCGLSSKDNVAVGQVKTVHKETPLICKNYCSVDLSLGTMRNGVGSMSTQDRWFIVKYEGSCEKLRAAQESGQLVKVVYNEARETWCAPDAQIVSVESVKE